MNTRRYPRTMAEAFGPYTDNRLHAPSERGRNWATVVYAVMLVAAIAATVIVGVPR